MRGAANSFSSSAPVQTWTWSCELRELFAVSIRWFLEDLETLEVKPVAPFDCLQKSMERGARGDAAGFAYLIGAVWSCSDPNSADWALPIAAAFPQRFHWENGFEAGLDPSGESGHTPSSTAKRDLLGIFSGQSCGKPKVQGLLYGVHIWLIVCQGRIRSRIQGDILASLLASLPVLGSHLEQAPSGPFHQKTGPHPNHLGFQITEKVTTLQFPSHPRHPSHLNPIALQT